MANTANITLVTTANTFDQWRIQTNLLIDDVEEIARENFVKERGSVTVNQGTLTLANSSVTTLLDVKSGARIDGTLSVRTIDQDAAGDVTLASGDIVFSNRASGGLFGVNVNTKFDAANVEFSNGNVFFSNASATGLVVVRPNTNFLTNVTVTGTLVAANGMNVTDQANAARNQANTAYGQANAAYDAANNRVLKVGDTMTGNLNVAASIISQNIVPNINVTYNIGEPTKRFMDLYLANSTIYLGDATISASGLRVNVEALNVNTNAAITVANIGTINSTSIIAGTVTATTLIVTDPISAPAETNESSYRLRVNSTSRGDGAFGIRLGSTANGNAWINFDTAAGNVWRVTANSTEGTYYTLLTVQNVVDSVVSTSTTGAAAPNSVKTSYDQASDARDQANNARNQANTARTTANDAYGQANTAVTNAATANTNALNAYGQANTANTNAVNAYSQANTANTNALNAYGQANAARDQANTARNDANTTFATINTTFGTLNTSAGTQNTWINNLNTATATINTHLGTINTTLGTVNSTFATMNSTFSSLNTSQATQNTNITNAYNAANSAFAQANSALPTLNIISGTSVTAVKNQHYVLKNASATTVTLPASPAAGDAIWISTENNITTNIIARNGSNIKSLAEDLTLDVANVAVQLRYVDSTVGWTFT